MSQLVFPRIKICGIRDALFIEQLAALPVHAIGLMFYAASKRYVSIAEAQALISRVPPFIQVVGVFVDPTVEWVSEVLSQVPLDKLQFHGRESEAFCRQFDRPYIKAISMDSDTDLQHCFTSYDSASGLLLDNAKGGTGHPFDWQTLPTDLPQSVIIAGGISQHNIRQLMQQHAPKSIDLSSGVETATGEKSIEKLKQLLQVIDESF
jgi:phosphoribosylanthranilate isomerase